jgi:hypothetical protein
MGGRGREGAPEMEMDVTAGNKVKFLGYNRGIYSLN